MEAAPPTDTQPDLPAPQKPPEVRELTVRSVIAAVLVAVIIGASYPYVVLKFGFGPNISVVSAFFGFLMLGLVSKSYNRWENNIVQTAGTAAGQIAFMCWLLAGFQMLQAADPSFDVEIGPFQTFAWFSVAGLLGVFLAVPLRKHFIVDEKLAFPDGIAAGETLILLDSRGAQAKKSASAMVGALGAAIGMQVLMLFKVLHEVVIFGVNKFSAVTGVGMNLGLLSIGSGMIIGLRVCTSMLLGVVLGWVVGPMWLEEHGYITAEAKKPAILLFVMWPATGMLIAGGLTALVLKWRTLVASFRGLSSGASATGDFPMRWVITGVVTCSLLLILLQEWMVGTPWWQSLIAILVSLPLMVVALRVLGETNWGPISTMVNVMQACFGAIAPGNLKAGMVASGVTGSVAAESEGLMQDYKTGHMIGSTPRLLTYMQLMAVPIGALMLALVYPLLVKHYGILGEGAQLSSPTSVRWMGFAQLLKQIGASGDDLTPELARRIDWMQYSFLGGALLGIALTILENIRGFRNYVPSVTGMGIGMLVPAHAVFTMFVGALIDHCWRWISPVTQAAYSVPLASGFIAGEALYAVAIPILSTLGVPLPE